MANMMRKTLSLDILLSRRPETATSTLQSTLLFSLQAETPRSSYGDGGWVLSLVMGSITADIPILNDSLSLRGRQKWCLLRDIFT